MEKTNRETMRKWKENLENQPYGMLTDEEQYLLHLVEDYKELREIRLFLIRLKDAFAGLSLATIFFTIRAYPELSLPKEEVLLFGLIFIIFTAIITIHESEHFQNTDDINQIDSIIMKLIPGLTHKVKVTKSLLTQSAKEVGLTGTSDYDFLGMVNLLKGTQQKMLNDVSHLFPDSDKQ